MRIAAARFPTVITVRDLAHLPARSTPQPRPRPTVVAGRYLPLWELGRGGMAIVTAAWDTRLGRTVALKRPLRAADHHQAECLRREARLLACISHPNVVAIHDTASLSDEPFIALELVDGPTLATWLAAAPRPWTQVLAAFLAAGQGLAAVHAASLVHRDVKPANVLIGRDGRPRLADFGLAIDADEPGAVGSASGTPAYMAPEQAAGGRPGPLGDQYSFAVGLHEALWAVRPPGARAISRSAPVAPAIGPIPPGLRAVVERAAAPEPGRRYPGMAQLLGALGRAAG